MTTLSDPVAELSAKLTAAKEDTGLSYKQIERAVTRLLGDDAPTHETIRSYHDGKISLDRVNDRLVVALCRVYNRPLAEMAPFVLVRFEQMRSLIDVGEHRSACTDESAVQRTFGDHLFDMEYERVVEEQFADAA